MSDDILDIAKWKQKYPFLNTVWNTYNQFDQPVEGDEYKYEGVCNPLMKQLSDNNEKHKVFCFKLVRNLGCYAPNTEFFDPTFERCNILYNWLYHSSQKEKITDDIIKKCFDDYIDQINKMTGAFKCSYDYYKNMYLEPIKINILNLFDNNIQTIRQILIGRDDSKKIQCRKFVCECVKIYKHMNDTYCHNGRGKQENSSNTCSKLNDFKRSYTLLHSNGGLSNLNIPSLDYIDRDFIAKCPSDEGKITLSLHEAKTLQPLFGNGLNTVAQGPSNSLTEVTPLGNEDNSMKKNITTTIGTVAGASSVLAFLYKFTPTGRLLNARLRRSGGRINNNLYANEESELLFDGFANRDINSYNIGYEAA